MTVSAPPRPASERTTPDSKPLERDEIEALVEALIEEARRETRRRHRTYWAVAALVTFVGVVVLTLLEGGAASQTASPALSVRMNPAAQTVPSKIAFIREPPKAGYAGVLWVMNPDGSGQRSLAPACPGMRWSPDGQKITFAAIVVQPDRLTSDVYVMNADGSGQERLTSDPSWESGLAWSPDGRKIAFASGLGNSEIHVMNADRSEQRRLTNDAWGGELAWSPRGDKIAFVRRRDGNQEIYVMNPDGSGQRRLTRNTVGDRNPVWSPDGRRIAFESNWQVYLMNADGSGQRRLTRNGARNFAPAWSPDGQRIAFERRVGRKKYGSCSGCGRASTFQVYVMNTDGSAARMLAQDGAQPFWSPDGQKIAFERKSDIYVMNADGSGQRKLTRGAHRESQPVWSPGLK